MRNPTYGLEEVFENLKKSMTPEGRRAFERGSLQGRADAIGEIFGIQVKKLRLEAGLTQVELADVTGIQQREITRIETGNANPTLRTMQRLMLALGHELAIQPDSRQKKQR